MNVENFSSAWRRNISCEECSTRLNMFRKKKVCFFCKNSFCQLCIIHREDQKFCCRKCQILTARPLDRNKLLNLKSRDLINYLASRRIPTNGCVEKEDLVNVLMRAVNNSCFHPSSSSCFDGSSSTNSYPNSPRNTSFSTSQLSQSVENLHNEDGIRITGQGSESDVQSSHVHGEGSVSHQANGDEQIPHFSRVQAKQNDEENVAGTDQATPRNDTDLDDCAQEGEGLATNKPLMLSDIKSSSDLEALTVKQLKELLMRNRTDFKGCIERAELIQKANRLWSDYTVSRKDLENLSLDELCKICMDAPIECVLLECGHMATCTSCGKQLCECPICRQFVVRCVRTFKA